jgi:hypothetical protein
MPLIRNMVDFSVTNNVWFDDIELMGRTELEIRNVIFG